MVVDNLFENNLVFIVDLVIMLVLNKKGLEFRFKLCLINRILVSDIFVGGYDWACSSA